MFNQKYLINECKLFDVLKRMLLDSGIDKQTIETKFSDAARQSFANRVPHMYNKAVLDVSSDKATEALTLELQSIIDQEHFHIPKCLGVNSHSNF